MKITNLERNNLQHGEKMNIYIKLFFEGIPIFFKRNNIRILDTVQLLEKISSDIIEKNQKNINEFQYSFPNLAYNIVNALSNNQYELKELSQSEKIQEEIKRTMESKKSQIIKIIDLFGSDKSKSELNISKCIAKILLELNFKLSNTINEENPIKTFVNKFYEMLLEMINKNNLINFDSIQNILLQMLDEKNYMHIIKLKEKDIIDLIVT